MSAISTGLVGRVFVIKAESLPNSHTPPPPPLIWGAEAVGGLGRVARRLTAGLAFVFFALVALAAPENARAAKTVAISTASTTITEGDSGKKDVTINVKLGEGTPTRVGFNVEFVAGSSTATDNTNVGTTSCSAPSSGADICYPGVFSDNAFVNVNIGTNGSFAIGILGDTADEGTGETVALRLVPNSLARSDGWTQNSNTLILTITDNDDGTTAVPATPTGLLAEAGDTRVTLSWTDPDDDSITRYQVRRKKGAAGWGGWTAISGSDAATVRHTVTGLDNDVEYRFRIRARNSGGNGRQSAVVEATPSASAAVPKPELSAEAGYASVTLSWSALSGVTVASWGYQYKPDGGSWSGTKTIDDGSATSHTVSGLTVGTKYTFRLFARTGSGAQSVWSDQVKATPTNTVPKPVLTAAGSDASATLSWNALSGIPITSWGYQYKSSGGWSTTTTLTGGSRTSVKVTGLTNGTKYTFRLFAAVRPGVQSSWSDQVKATPMPLPGVTLKPMELELEEGDSGSYTVVLSSKPLAAVTVSVGGTTAEVTATPSRLTFTTADWSTAQTVTVTAVEEDDDTMTDPPTRLTHVATSRGYGSVSVGTVEVSVKEDDPGGTVAPTELTVVEGGSGSYTVVLHTKPSASVTVTVGGASGDVSAAPSSLTFTTATWNVPVTVTVSAAADEDAEAEVAVTLTHATAGGGYDDATLSDVSVSVSETTPILQLSADPSVTAEGEAIRLTVASDKAVTGMLTVRLRLSAREESGFDAEDVEGGLGPRDFQADFGAEAGMAGIVLIPTAGDQGSEGEEAYRVELLSGTGYAVGADALADGIVSDRLGAAARASRVNAAALPQALAAAVAQATGVIARRIELAASGVEPEALDLGAALASGAGADGAGLDWRAALSGTALATGLTGADGSRVASVWVRGALSSLDGSEDGVSWDGEVWSAHAGVDFRARPDVLAGVAASYAEGDLDTEADGVRGRHETRLASVRPYMAWLLEDGSSLWASASYGRGKVRVREDGQATREADLRTRSASAGGWRTLSERSGAGGDVLRLALRGEGSLARARTDAEDGLEGLSVDASRVRLALEGSRERVLEDGGRLTPALEAGARYDGGDATDGAGAELGASVSYLDGTGRMSVELRTRALVAHEADRDEWSASARMSVTPEASGRGPSLRLSLGRGDAGSGLARLFAREGSSARLGEAEARTRLEAEVGQGLSGPWAGLATPYAGLSVEESGLALLRLGTRYRRGETLALALEAETGDESRIALRASLQW